MPYLLLLGAWAALMLIGLLRRRHQGRPTDRAVTSKLAWVSFGLAGATVGVIVPALWLFVSIALYGGTVESNVPPGYSAQFVLNILLLGSAFVGISAIYGYIEHLSS